MDLSPGTRIVPRKGPPGTKARPEFRGLLSCIGVNSAYLPNSRREIKQLAFDSAAKLWQGARQIAGKLFAASEFYF